MEFIVRQLLVTVLLLCCLPTTTSVSSSLTQHAPLCHVHEKLALLQFKQSFVINCASSDHNSVRSYPRMKSWESYEADEIGDCCTWDGVECDKNTGYVIELDLSFSCLFGTFPSNSTLFNLMRLEKLNLAHNDFNFSQIPATIAKLDQLESLNLSQSVFSGQIPTQISELSKLRHLDLSYNGDRLGSSQLSLKLHKPNLHRLVQNFTRLNQLFLDGVDISSNLPISLTNLSSLKVISLMYCNVIGVLPLGIFQLPNLQVLDLSSNRKLTGHLHEFRSHNYALRKLDLSATSLTGELPFSIGNFASLEIIRLWGSGFSGKIPSSLGNLTKLIQLSLSGNDFEGEFPSSIKNLTNLRMLGISSLNVTTGNLRSWLPRLNKLATLGLGYISGVKSVYHNDLSFLANLTQLSYLDLSGNQIFSPLPHWLANMTMLTWFNVADNQFQGKIPKWFSHLTRLRFLSLSHSNLSGEFEIFFNLKNLDFLDLSGINLTFTSTSILNSSFDSKQFSVLNLDSCNLMEFPRFLQNQNELQFLSLGGNNIKGAIPKWFMNVSQESLLVLDLSENLLTSFEQSTLVLPWRRLKLLDVTGNRINGLLPYPSYFTEFYLVSDNYFSGAIPQQLCSRNSLAFLDLSDNELSGKIPACIGKLLSTSLIALNMRGNKFSGIIPQRFTSSCKLKMINLSENQLEGRLPKSLANCKMLQVLDLGKNHLNDSFPDWLRTLSDLQVLVLRNNFFYGSIPSPISRHDFQNLRVLDLSNNFHTGNLPFDCLRNWKKIDKQKEDQQDSSNIIIPSIFSVVDMIYFENQIYNFSITITNKGSERFYSKILYAFQLIDFSSNKFTSQISDSIGNFTGLRALNLSNNNLYGHIPASLANISELESLDLSHNMLSGTIPQELLKLTSLEVFDVSNNNLSGPVPEGEQFDTFDESSYAGNLGLCGSQLSNKCGDPNTLAPLSFQVDDDEYEEETPLIDWVVRLSGCVSGLIAGFIVGKYYVTDRYHGWFLQTFGREW